MEETGRDRYFAQREVELAALVDPETGLVAERYARRIPCPVCGAAEDRTLFVKRGFPIVRCESCRLVFANPQVDESLVVEEYRGGISNDLWVDVLTSPQQLELDRVKFDQILDALEPFRGAGRLLDVGCSIGLFLDRAGARGWRGTGIEFSDKARAYAREEFGLDVLGRPLAEEGFEPDSFDVVTLLSVLEHTTEPRRMLREIAAVLKPGGVLYVIVPNVESLACRVLHEHAATFDGRNHLLYFSGRSLTDVLAREGYEAQLTTTRVTSFDPVLEWLNYEEPYSGSAPSDDPLVEWAASTDLWPTFERLGLGYKLHSLSRRAT
jgi:2-polyprenyl-3-methyl-5-hydroxy-6-metoxy-1,4-benzoquinol methylase